MPHKIGHTDPKITKERLSGLRSDITYFKKKGEEFIKSPVGKTLRSFSKWTSPGGYLGTTLAEKFLGVEEKEKK